MKCFPHFRGNMLSKFMTVDFIFGGDFYCTHVKQLERGAASLAFLWQPPAPTKSTCTKVGSNGGPGWLKRSWFCFIGAIVRNKKDVVCPHGYNQAELYVNSQMHESPRDELRSGG